MILISSFRAGAIALTLLVASVAVEAQTSNLLANGGFETGDLSHWFVTGPLDYVGADSFAAHSGGYGAFFGPETPATLTQSVATAAGGTYQVSFWLSLQDSAQPNSFSWSWNGASQAVSFDNAAGFGYQEFTALLGGAPALSTLSFTFTDPQSFWLLDEVAVAAVPEPSTAVLTGVAAIWLVFLRRRRHCKASPPAARLA